MGSQITVHIYLRLSLSTMVIRIALGVLRLTLEFDEESSTYTVSFPSTSLSFNGMKGKEYVITLLSVISMVSLIRM